MARTTLPLLERGGTFLDVILADAVDGSVVVVVVVVVIVVFVAVVGYGVSYFSLLSQLELFFLLLLVRS